jgi:UDP:flavonoid glycosyltransferase YjiC (YdhE family)
MILASPPPCTLVVQRNRSTLTTSKANRLKERPIVLYSKLANPKGSFGIPATRKLEFQLDSPIGDSLKIIIATLPITGRTNPALNVGSILVKAGHEVVFTSGQSFRARAESCGLRFISSPASGIEDMLDVNSRFPERNRIPVGPERVLFDFKHLFCDPMPAQYQGLLSILEKYPADVILADNFFGGILPFLLQRNARPVIAGLGVNPLIFHRDDHAPFGPGLPPVAASSPAAEKYLRIAEEVDSRMTTPLRAYADGILQKLGVGPLPMSWLDSFVALPDLFLQLGSPSVEIPRGDLPKTVHIVGVLPSFTKGSLPKEIQPFLESGKPIVAVTQGTLANHELDQVLQPTLDALAERDDLLVIGTTGGVPVSTLERAVPKNAMVFSYLPWDEVLQHSSVFVTNGGFGSVCRAISLGLPMVVAGKGEDKAEVAMRIAHAGAGIDLRTDRPTPETLVNAIDSVLEEGSSYKLRSREIANELARIDTPTKIVELLQAAVDARRSVTS